MKQIPGKYVPFVPTVPVPRRWPERTLTAPPVWCSVDLRDGNQALPEPMEPEEKLEFFRMLTQVGFRQIEVGYPAASETEFRTVRTLIEKDLIPEDVTIQVISAAREDLIRRTFDAIRGAKRVIFNFYNPISPVQQRVVFSCGPEGVKAIALEAAALVRRLGEEARAAGMELTFQYSPESYTSTPQETALDICAAVLDALGATAEQPAILDLTATVECCAPNQFADRIEDFIRRLPGRERAVISVHPHNDRGTAVAAAELALLAGAQRVEGTLFGSGERTGNVDLMTMAMNLHTQGVDPGLDFSRMDRVRQVYERCMGMLVPERHPYAGSLVLTAFSGAHQDAIGKGLANLPPDGSWQVPYLPLDPADIGRQYEEIIRINSQSGKNGAAYVMEKDFGYHIPRAMRGELGALVQAESDRTGREVAPGRIFDLFREEYVNRNEPYRLLHHAFEETTDREGHSHVLFRGELQHKDTVFQVTGEGNGPIDAFFNAIHGQKLDRFRFVDYSEHAITDGSDSRAVAYIHLRHRDGRDFFGVGVSHNINLAPLRGILSAVNRAAQS